MSHAMKKGFDCEPNDQIPFKLLGIRYLFLSAQGANVSYSYSWVSNMGFQSVNTTHE